MNIPGELQHVVACILAAYQAREQMNTADDGPGCSDEYTRQLFNIKFALAEHFPELSAAVLVWQTAGQKVESRPRDFAVLVELMADLAVERVDAESESEHARLINYAQALRAELSACLDRRIDARVR